MSNRKLLLLLFAVVLLAAQGPAVYAGSVSIRDYGAVGDGETDDAPALARAIEAGMGGAVQIPAGTYLIGSSFSVELVGDLSIQGGEGDTVLLFAGNSSISISSPVVEPASRMLAENAPRGSRTVVIESTEGIKPGDLASFLEPTAAETAWNFRTLHLSYIVSVDGENSRIEIRDPLNFNFKVEGGAQVTVYRPQGELSADGLALRVKDLDRGNGRQMVTLTALRHFSLENIRIEGNTDFRHRGINISGCIDSAVRNVQTNRMNYPFLINNSRNIRFKKIESHNCRHPVTVGAWNDGIYVDNLRGHNNQGIVESHPSFNVHYNNVISGIEARQSNLRSVGGSIRNSLLVYTGQRGAGPYFQTVALVDEDIYADYTFEMENVVWVGPAPIMIRRVGTAILRNVRCVDLDGNEAGVGIGTGVGRAVLHNTLPEKALLPGYSYLPANVWSSVGPFPDFWEEQRRAGVEEAMNLQYRPEKDYLSAELSLTDEYLAGDGERTLRWKSGECVEGYLMKEGLNLGIRHEFRNFGICYALTHVYSPEDRDADIYIGCDFWAKGWLNGEELGSVQSFEGVAFRGESRQHAALDLRKGWNTLLIKVHGGSGGASFTAVISDPGDLLFSSSGP